MPLLPAPDQTYYNNSARIDLTDGMGMNLGDSYTFDASNINGGHKFNHEYMQNKTYYTDNNEYKLIDEEDEVSTHRNGGI